MIGRVGNVLRTAGSCVQARGFSSTIPRLKDVNMVVIVGHVGADPEFLELPGITTKTGQPVGYFKFNVATNYSYKVPTTDEYESKVSWNRISVPGDHLSSEVQKGAKVYVHGRLQSWAVEGKYGVEIVARPRDVKVLKQAAHNLEETSAAQSSGQVQYPPLSLQALNASKVGTLEDGTPCSQSGDQPEVSNQATL